MLQNLRNSTRLCVYLFHTPFFSYNSSLCTSRPESLRPSQQSAFVQQADAVLPSTATVVEVQDSPMTQPMPSVSRVHLLQYGALMAIQSSSHPAPLYSAQPVYPPAQQQPYYVQPQTASRLPAVQTQYNVSYVPPNTYAYHSSNQAPRPTYPGQHTFRLDEHTRHAPQYNPRAPSGPAGRGGHWQQPQVNSTAGQELPAEYYGAPRLLDKTDTRDLTR